MINIEDKAILSSSLAIMHSANASIIGQNNFTVLCVNGGKLTILLSNNLTMQGITWIGCGGRWSKVANAAIEVIAITYSSVMVQQSTFLYSRGPAIGSRSSHFIINQCNFTNKGVYRGHGAGIIIRSSSHSDGTQIINNCDFS